MFTYKYKYVRYANAVTEVESFDTGINYILLRYFTYTAKVHKCSRSEYPQLKVFVYSCTLYPSLRLGELGFLQ